MLDHNSGSATPSAITSCAALHTFVADPPPTAGRPPGSETRAAAPNTGQAHPNTAGRGNRPRQPGMEHRRNDVSEPSSHRSRSTARCPATATLTRTRAAAARAGPAVFAEPYTGQFTTATTRASNPRAIGGPDRRTTPAAGTPGTAPPPPRCPAHAAEHTPPRCAFPLTASIRSTHADESTSATALATPASARRTIHTAKVVREPHADREHRGGKQRAATIAPGASRSQTASSAPPR